MKVNWKRWGENWGYWVELCTKHVEKQICRRPDFISSATHNILSSLSLWSFLLWFLFFFFAIYIQKSHLNDSDLFSWHFEDVIAIQPTFAGWKWQPPFQAPPPWATLRTQKPKQRTPFFPSTLSVSFSFLFFFLGVNAEYIPHIDTGELL